MTSTEKKTQETGKATYIAALSDYLKRREKEQSELLPHFLKHTPPHVHICIWDDVFDGDDFWACLSSDGARIPDVVAFDLLHHVLCFIKKDKVLSAISSTFRLAYHEAALSQLQVIGEPEEQYLSTQSGWRLTISDASDEVFSLIERRLNKKLPTGPYGITLIAAVGS